MYKFLTAMLILASCKQAQGPLSDQMDNTGRIQLSIPEQEEAHQKAESPANALKILIQNSQTQTELSPHYMGMTDSQWVNTVKQSGSELKQNQASLALWPELIASQNFDNDPRQVVKVKWLLPNHSMATNPSSTIVTATLALEKRGINVRATLIYLNIDHKNVFTLSQVEFKPGTDLAYEKFNVSFPFSGLDVEASSLTTLPYTSTPAVRFNTDCEGCAIPHQDGIVLFPFSLLNGSPLSHKEWSDAEWKYFLKSKNQKSNRPMFNELNNLAARHGISEELLRNFAQRPQKSINSIFTEAADVTLIKSIGFDLVENLPLATDVLIYVNGKKRKNVGPLGQFRIDETRSYVIPIDTVATYRIGDLENPMISLRLDNGWFKTHLVDFKLIGSKHILGYKTKSSIGRPKVMRRYIDNGAEIKWFREYLRDLSR